MKCRDGRRVTTTDELVLDGLGQCAVFGPGHMSRPEGDDVVIYDGDNAHVATFPNGGKKYRFLTSTGGHLGVFKLAQTKDEATRDAAGERCAAMIRQRLEALNEANRIFWAVRNGGEETVVSVRTKDEESPYARLNRQHAEFYK